MNLCTQSYIMHGAHYPEGSFPLLEPRVTQYLAASHTAPPRAYQVCLLCVQAAALALIFFRTLVQVEWELESPRSGIVFKTARDGFSADQMYTTYSHAPVDMDGPR